MLRVEVIFLQDSGVIALVRYALVIAVIVGCHSWNEKETFGIDELAFDALVSVFPSVSCVMGINRAGEVKGSLGGHGISNGWNI